MSMTIGSLAPWFGGKRTLATEIIHTIGPHSVYWEPFCGSMAILMAMEPCRMETVNDLHGDLVNLARVIADPVHGPQLYRRLRRTWLVEHLFREALDRIREPFHLEVGPSVDRAHDYFVVSWQGMNGVAGTNTTSTNFAKRFSSKGGDNGTRWRSAVSSIPQWRKRIAQVQILNSCGITLCEKIEDREGTAIYCDPPYIVKGAKYKHDFTLKDHARLARALRRFKRTRVVVSYYEHLYLERFYPGWDRVGLDATKTLVSQGKRDRTGTTQAPEVLLVNQRIEPTLF